MCMLDKTVGEYGESEEQQYSKKQIAKSIRKVNNKQLVYSLFDSSGTKPQIACSTWFS